MAQRIGGFRRKTRAKFRRPVSERGKLSITNYLQDFDESDRVVLKANPAYQKGMYFPRFHGKNGLVKGKQGECYKVALTDGDKKKIIIVHPLHLKKLN